MSGFWIAFASGYRFFLSYFFLNTFFFPLLIYYFHFPSVEASIVRVQKYLTITSSYCRLGRRQLTFASVYSRIGTAGMGWIG